MEISTVLNASVASGSIKTSGEQLAAATKKPSEGESPQAESTRVQLSAFGQAKSATAQSETAASLLDNKNLEAAANSTAAAQAQSRRAGQPQQGFSFNGVVAYSRVFSS